MNFVIPMAGKGQRFIDAGYKEPKMLIKAKGKTLLEWSLDSLPFELCSKLIFIALTEHETKWGISEFIKEKYSGKWELIIHFIDQTTQGQAETVLKAESMIKKEEALLIFNIDTYFDSPNLKNQLVRTDIDGVLGSFKDTSPRFSFAKTGPGGFISYVTEKDPVSDNALTGLYFFSKANDFLDIAKKCIDNDEKTKGEFYIAPMYNKLIANNKKYILDQCEKHFILGTPGELDLFIKI